MIHDSKKEKPISEEITLSDIVTNEEDKKILEPVVKEAPRSNTYIIGVVNKNGAFIRKEANENSNILQILAKGDCVIVNHDKDTDDYYYASMKSVIGYILKSDITIE